MPHLVRDEGARHLPLEERVAVAPDAVVRVAVEALAPADRPRPEIPLVPLPRPRQQLDIALAPILLWRLEPPRAVGLALFDLLRRQLVLPPDPLRVRDRHLAAVAHDLLVGPRHSRGPT